MPTYESVFRLDPLDQTNALQLIADRAMSGLVTDSPFEGVTDVACFDDHIYFNSRERGLYRWNPDTDNLIKLIDVTQVGAPPEHTNGSAQHVASIKSAGDALFVATESDLLVSYDGLNFQSMLSPGVNSFESSLIDERARIVISDSLGNFFIYNTPDVGT